MRSNTSTVVVMAADTWHADSWDQLTHLVARLVERGYAVETLLPGDTEPAGRLRALAKVTILDGNRVPGMRNVLEWWGSGSATEKHVSRRVHRYLKHVAVHPWIICDPEAFAYLQQSELRPPVVVALLAGPGIRTMCVEAAGPRTLPNADLWLTLTTGQAANIRDAGPAAPVHTIGDLWESDLDPPAQRSFDADGPVLLSTPSGAWDSVSHTIEVIAQLRRRAPELPLVWLTDPGEDEWLARHDIAHLDLPQTGQVTLSRRDDTPWPRPRLIVRTGYTASDPDLVLAAALAQVPTIGFEVGDLPPVAMNAITPFAVEELVDRTIDLLDDRRRGVVGAALAAAVRQRPGPHARLKPLYDLLGSAG